MYRRPIGAVVTVQRFRRRLQMSRLDSTRRTDRPTDGRTDGRTGGQREICCEIIALLRVLRCTSYHAINNKSVFGFLRQLARICCCAPCCCGGPGPQQQTRLSGMQRSIHGTDGQTPSRTMRAVSITGTRDENAALCKNSLARQGTKMCRKL